MIQLKDLFLNKKEHRFNEQIIRLFPKEFEKKDSIPRQVTF